MLLLKKKRKNKMKISKYMVFILIKFFFFTFLKKKNYFYSIVYLIFRERVLERLQKPVQKFSFLMRLLIIIEYLIMAIG